MGISLPGRLVLCIVGLLLLFFCLFYKSKWQSVVKNGLRTIAVIRDYSAGPSGQYFYIYEYIVQGKKYTGAGNVSVERISRKKIGKTEEIICRKDDPRQFVIAKDPVMGGAMLILAAAGVGLIVAGILLH